MHMEQIEETSNHLTKTENAGDLCTGSSYSVSAMRISAHDLITAGHRDGDYGDPRRLLEIKCTTNAPSVQLRVSPTVIRCILDYLPVSTKCSCLWVEDGVMEVLAGWSIDKSLSPVKNGRFLINHHQVLKTYRRQVLYDNNDKDAELSLVFSAIRSCESFLVDELEKLLPQLRGLSTLYVKQPTVSYSATSYSERMRSAITKILDVNAGSITECGFLKWPGKHSERVEQEQKRWPTKWKDQANPCAGVLTNANIGEWISRLPQLEVLCIPSLFDSRISKAENLDAWRFLRSAGVSGAAENTSTVHEPNQSLILPQLRHVIILYAAGILGLTPNTCCDGIYITDIIDALPQVTHVTISWYRPTVLPSKASTIIKAFRKTDVAFPSITSYACLTVLDLDLTDMFDIAKNMSHAEKIGLWSQRVVKFLTEISEYQQPTKIHVELDWPFNRKVVNDVAQEFGWFWSLMAMIFSHPGGSAFSVCLQPKCRHVDWVDLRKLLDLFVKCCGSDRSRIRTLQEAERRKASFCVDVSSHMPLYAKETDSKSHKKFKLAVMQQLGHLVSNDSYEAGCDVLMPYARNQDQGFADAYCIDSEKRQVFLI